jgi:glycosyl transferase family 87
MSRRLDRVMLALVVALAAAGLIVILAQPAAARLSSDFTINYSAGALILKGQFAAPYNQSELGGEMRRVSQGTIDPRLPFSLPLAAGLPYAALSLLPLEPAFRLWQLVTVVLLLVAVLLLQRAFPLSRAAPTLTSSRWGEKLKGATGLAMLGLLAAVPTWATLTEGQPTAGLFLGGAMAILALRSDAPGWAAGAGLLLAVKPQYMPAYLAILFAARRWRSLAAACTAAGLLLLSPLAGGGGALSAMIHNALSANQAVPVRLNESWIGIIGPLLSASATTLVAIALYLGVLVALGLTAWRRPAGLIGYAALAGSLTVLASPHALPHDLLILAVPAWLTVVLYRQGALPNPLPGLLLIELALLIDLHGIAVPLGPIVMTVVVAWYGWQFRQRAEQQRRPLLGRVA